MPKGSCIVTTMQVQLPQVGFLVSHRHLVQPLSCSEGRISTGGRLDTANMQPSAWMSNGQCSSGVCCPASLLYRSRRHSAATRAFAACCSMRTLQRQCRAQSRTCVQVGYAGGLIQRQTHRLPCALDWQGQVLHHGLIDAVDHHQARAVQQQVVVRRGALRSREEMKMAGRCQQEILHSPNGSRK